MIKAKYLWFQEMSGMTIPPLTFRVLVELHNYTDGHGRNAYPGIKNLAAAACCSEKTVRRALVDLEDTWGVIKRMAKGGRSGDGKHWASRYELFSPLGDAYRAMPANASVGQNPSSHGQTDDIDWTEDYRSDGQDDDVDWTDD
jgi:hypothetical protein